MRYLRWFAIVALVLVLLFAGWAIYQYRSDMNTDRPVLTSSVKELQISVNDPQTALLQGLHASDATDGDLTDRIMVASMSHFLEPGTVNVKYVVFDSHNNSATLTRRVHYVDYTPPQFSLDKAPAYTVGQSFDLLHHIQVQDCIDGDISDRIRVISNMVNNFSVGHYPVVLEVSNSCGDTTQITIWVSYTNQKSTATVRLHQYIVYLSQGETFEPRQWIASVADTQMNPLSKDRVEIQGNLDTNTPGSYQLVYNYNDGTYTGQSALTVVVTERQD